MIMNSLKNISNLVENLTGKIEALIDEREVMLAEISSLRERLTERDKEAVKTAQDMRSELEIAQIKVLRFEQERIRIEAKLQNLNDRLVDVAAIKNEAEAELLGGS